mgnify:CR=1 FL=1
MTGHELAVADLADLRLFARGGALGDLVVEPGKRIGLILGLDPVDDIVLRFVERVGDHHLQTHAHQHGAVDAIDQGSIPLIQGVNTYDLPADTIDLLEHVIRTNAGNTSTQSDLTITRISVSTYATIPNKIQQARPIQVWVQRLDGQTYNTGATLATGINATDTEITVSDASGLNNTGFINLGSETIQYGYITGNTLYNCFRAQNNSTAVAHLAAATVYWAQLPAITVWPVPDQGTTSTPYYQFTYYRMRRVQNAGSGVQTPDMNFRFYPALVSGLAYYIAMKIPDGLNRLQVLKDQYDEAWNLASGEDHEKAAVRFVPRQMFIGSGT